MRMENFKLLTPTCFFLFRKLLKHESVNQSATELKLTQENEQKTRTDFNISM